MLELAEDEMWNFGKVWASVFVSLSYCFTIGKITNKGLIRLIALLPIICTFMFLPLNLTSLHFCGFTAFFIAWLANFKLFLFAFGKPPLSADRPISFPRFLALACLPIKIQNSSRSEKGTNRDAKLLDISCPPPKHSQKPGNNQCPDRRTPKKSYPFPRKPNGTNEDQELQGKLCPPTKEPQKSKNNQCSDRKTPEKSCESARKLPWSYIIKGALLGLILHTYSYSHQIPTNVLNMMYFLNIYITMEMILALLAKSAQLFLGLELEPQFNEPLLSTSLQDFWGRRWNLMVTSLMRPMVFRPARDLSIRALGPNLARMSGVMGTFIISGLMHELIFCYLGRMGPSFAITCFFILHGFCLCLEIAAKRYAEDQWQVPRWVSVLATATFVVGTAFWLFLPPLLEAGLHTKGVQEYKALGAFVSRVVKLG